jgi:hypothetical protein
MKSEKSIFNYDMCSIMRVTDKIGPIVNGSKSYALRAIMLTDVYNGFDTDEKACMLDILRSAYNGKLKAIIPLMNIKQSA